MFEIVYTIVFLICFICILPILIYYVIKEEKQRKALEKEFMDTLKAINKDINYIRNEIENVSKEM